MTNNNELKDLLQIMDELKDTEARLKFELKNTEKEQAKYETLLIEFLNKNNYDNYTSGIYSFGWKKIKRKVFDQKLFGEENPELLEKYKLEKETLKFEFKIN